MKGLTSECVKCSDDVCIFCFFGTVVVVVLLWGEREMGEKERCEN